MRLSCSKCLMLGAVMTLLIAFPILAQPVFADSGTRRLQGHGLLFAAGAGEAFLKGDGSLTIICEGAGSVWIKGAEAVTAYGEGRKFDFAGGTMCIGWRGRIHTCGSQLEVHMMGGLIKFFAAGSGSAVLRGVGVVRVGEYFRDWPVTVDYLP
ncbi:hypothetical protein KEJ39_03375 [Candidatus Bathyarchaeota archaeon]|nr:hypothetical protein [Candidatus Bathyarchaeota archaeon]